MKNSALHDWYHLIGIIHACALTLVLIVILWKKLFFQRSFLALLVNYAVTCFYSLILLGAFPVSDNFKHIFGSINNLVDVPLMLFFLTRFMKGGILSKTITKTILLFVLIEIIILLTLGAGKKAETLILGPGILLVLFYTMSALVPQIKAGIDRRRETGKAFMITSVFFAYCCYSVLYLLFYIFQSPQKADMYAVYHLASLLSAMLMVTGLILEITNPADNGNLASPDKRQSKVVFPDWDEFPLKPER